MDYFRKQETLVYHHFGDCAILGMVQGLLQFHLIKKTFNFLILLFSFIGKYSEKIIDMVKQLLNKVKGKKKIDFFRDERITNLKKQKV